MSVSSDRVRKDILAHEIRGDAIVAEFAKASDALGAALEFQTANIASTDGLDDEVRPAVGMGIAMGEVVVADSTTTGEGVVLAQRLEQLAKAGGVCIQGAVYETIPKRLAFHYENLEECSLKGFNEPVRAYAAGLKPGPEIPDAQTRGTRDFKIIKLGIMNRFYNICQISVNG